MNSFVNAAADWDDEALHAAAPVNGLPPTAELVFWASTTLITSRRPQRLLYTRPPYERLLSGLERRAAADGGVDFVVTNIPDLHQVALVHCCRRRYRCCCCCC